MRQDPTSLDRLHDIVLPPAVPWWPLAPGWYVVLALLALVGAWLAWRSWKGWRARAYRRAALRELATLHGAPAIAELLRRTALASAPRAVVAERTGQAWADWLASRCREPMTDDVRLLLADGVYRRPEDDRGVAGLRDYAALWITRHEASTPSAGGAR